MNWTSDKVDQIAPALLAAQKVIKGAHKTAENPFLKNKYADLASVFEAVKTHLNEQGIAIIQSMGAVDGKTTMRTILLHTSGQHIAAEGFLPPIDPKGINAAQAMGSAISYMKRYQLQAITGCVGDGEDDDGNAAGEQSEPPITMEGLAKKIAEAKAIPHLANLWKKHTPAMDNMSKQEQKDLAILKDTRKASLSTKPEEAQQSADEGATEAEAIAQDAERGEG